MSEPGNASATTVKLPLELLDKDSLPRSRTFHDDHIEVSRLRGFRDASPLADESGDIERTVETAGGRTIDSDDSYHLVAGALVVQNLSGDLSGDSAVDSPRVPKKQWHDKALQLRKSWGAYKLQKRPEPRLKNAAPCDLLWARQLDDSQLVFQTGLDDLIDCAGPASAAHIPRVFVEQTV